MNYIDIRKCDSANGIGCRVSLFVSGCDLSPHCDECFNSQAWDFSAGNVFNMETLNKIIEYMKPDHIKGLSILGGDPISNVRKEPWLTELVIAVKHTYPDKTIFVWTGYSLEDICDIHSVRLFLKSIDMLRDGRYIKSLRNIKQYLQGSSNQRYIDVQHYLNTGEIRNYIFDKRSYIDT